jgi:hypothetical protein
VEDGIAACRAIIPRCWWAEARCETGIEYLSLYRRDYDPRQMIMRQKPKHDYTSHAADAFRTLMMGLKRAPPTMGDDVHQAVAQL